MKTNRIIILLMLAVTGFSACTVNQLDEICCKSEVKFVMEEPDTKSTLYTTLGCSWEDGDAIGVFCPETVPASDNTGYAADLTTGKAMFSYSGSGEAPLWNNDDIYHNFIIYYPYRGDVVDKIYKGTLPNDQNINGGYLPSIIYNFQYAKVSGKRTSDGTIPVREMKRQFGVIEFQIICDNPDELANKGITKAYYYPSKTIPCGAYSFNLENGSLSWTGKTTDTYTLDLTDFFRNPEVEYSDVKNAIRSVYMFVPPGSPIRGVYSVMIDGRTYSVTRDDVRTIEAGDFYTVSFVTNDLDDSFLNSCWVSESNQYYIAENKQFVDGHIYHRGDPYLDSTYDSYFSGGVYEYVYVVEDETLYVQKPEVSINFKHQVEGNGKGHIDFKRSNQNGREYENYIDYQVLSPNKAIISRNGGEWETFTRAESYPDPELTQRADNIVWYMENHNIGKGKLRKPANCFVAEPGDWVFFRPYKGNSKEIAEYTGFLSDGVTVVKLGWDQPYSAVIYGTLDESEKTIESVSMKTMQNGEWLVMVKTAAPGNAVVKSVSTVLSWPVVNWSWHIWVLDPAVQSYITPGENYEPNLSIGAISPDGPGLYYQWGRKDPFTRPNLPRHGDHQDRLIYNDVEVPVDETIEHYASLLDKPMTNPDPWPKSGKSIYDPCPRGYRVPDYWQVDVTPHPWNGQLGSIDRDRDFNPYSIFYWNAANQGSCYAFFRYGYNYNNYTVTDPVAGYVRCVRYSPELPD